MEQGYAWRGTLWCPHNYPQTIIFDAEGRALIPPHCDHGASTPPSKPSKLRVWLDARKFRKQLGAL